MTCGGRQCFAGNTCLYLLGIHHNFLISIRRAKGIVVVMGKVM